MRFFSSCNQPISCAKIIANNLVFSNNGDFSRGFFRLEIPKHLQEETTLVNKFAGNFHHDNILIKEVSALRNGFYTEHRKQNSKLEQLRIEQKYYELLPLACQKLSKEIQIVNSIIINNILKQAGISNKVQENISNAAYLSRAVFHQYSSQSQVTTQAPTPQLPPHEDFGYITIAQSDKAGLKIYENGKWTSIPHSPDYWTVIFGNCLKRLLQNHMSLIAPIHMVSTDENRVSTTWFCEPEPQSPVLVIKDNEILKQEPAFEFITQQYKKMYSPYNLNQMVPETLPNTQTPQMKPF